MRGAVVGFLVLAGSLGFGRAIAAPTSVPPITPPETSVVEPSDATVESLSNMFSPQIQQTVAACWEQGKVNLAAQPVQGWVVCQDGTVMEGISYESYINTVADLMAASTLVGIQTALEGNSQATPDMLPQLVHSPQGMQFLQSIVQTAVLQSGLQTNAIPQSTQILSEAVVSRLAAHLGNSSRLSQLLGAEEQRSTVRSEFCMAPGMTLSEASTAFPTLDSVQLFAICIHESGAAREVLQQLT